MTLKGGWKSMHDSEDIPQRDYHFKIIEYMGPNKAKEDPDDTSWAHEYVRVQIQDKAPKGGPKPDKEVVGRKTRIFLGNELEGWNFGFRDLQMSLRLDGDSKRFSGEDFVGLFFDGAISYGPDKKNPEITRMNVKPNIDWDYVNAETGTKKKGGARKTSSSRSKSSSSSAEARRAKRRSR